MSKSRGQAGPSCPGPELVLGRKEEGPSWHGARPATPRDSASQEQARVQAFTEMAAPPRNQRPLIAPHCTGSSLPKAAGSFLEHLCSGPWSARTSAGCCVLSPHSRVEVSPPSLPAYSHRAHWASGQPRTDWWHETTFGWNSCPSSPPGTVQPL